MLRIRTAFHIALICLAALILVSAADAFAAGLTVQPSNVGLQSIAVTANDIKPTACAALDLTDIITGSGTITGTSGNDLILGSGGNDSIDGGGGDDCIESGGGDDTLNGGDGTDVCIGGSGTDTFDNCETEVQ